MTVRNLLGLVLCVGLAGCGGSDTAGPPSQGVPTTGGDWPMYGHDTGRTSYNPDETAITLANLDRLTERFHVAVGIGEIPSSSGPVVANGRVYVGSSLAAGDNYFCFDASTGARVWSANVGHSPPFLGNVGIGSTAAVVDGRVVLGGGDPAYYGLDAATGAILWRHDMAQAAEAFAWSSPLVANELAYVGMSSRYKAVRGELRALDVRDGSVRARQYFVPEGRQGADIWNSPSLSPDGSSVVVASGNDFGGYDGPLTRAMIAMDPADLAIQASHKVAAFNQDLDFGTTPVFFHDAQGRNLVGANEKDGRFFAYELRSLGQGPVWQRATGLSVGAMPAYDPRTGPGGTLFIVGDNGVLFGVDPATGVDRWPPVAVGFATANLAAANGLVFMGAGGGSVAVIEAETGAILRVLDPTISGRTFSGSVLSHGVLYWMSGAYLNAWAVP